MDPRRRTMHVQRSSWNGQVTLPKGGRTRRLPLTERLALELQAHRHLKGARVLYYNGGTPPTNKEIRMWMERAQRRAMLPANGGCHILRHTFCSHLAMQGATAKAIEELAGHQDLTTRSGTCTSHRPTRTPRSGSSAGGRRATNPLETAWRRVSGVTRKRVVSSS